MVPPPPTEEPRFNSFALRVIRGLGLVDAVVAETQARAAAKTLREAKSVLSSSNSSRRNVEAIPKYISALQVRFVMMVVYGLLVFCDTARMVQAGSKSKSRYCSLILTEGDSAAGLVGKSWSILGHESYGSYTLGGKIANVNSTKLCSGVDGDASTTATDGLSSVDVDKLLKNNRIRALIRILGLELEVRGGTICGKTYTNTANLNYDRVIIMVDQDDDGSHIKGLLLAFFARLFPSLFVLPRFLWEFITPLVRVRAAVRDEGEQQVGALLAEFFDEGSYLEWRSQNPRAPPGHYYKGLGSSTDEEGREYFSAAARYCRPLVWESEADTEAIRMAFSKGTGAAAGRRAFIGDGGNVVTEEQEGRRGVAAAAAPPRFKDITLLPTPSDFLKAAPVPRGRSIHEFVERDVKECARALNKRAIPSVMDGLKPSQRKILWTCYQRRMYGPAQQKKVAQLGSDAASLTGYHHAEESLSRAIIKLAQEYVGSNNVALLVPGGQFGSRQMNGDDAAAPRYPYTWLQVRQGEGKRKNT